MRIFSKILSITFIVLLVLSLCLNVVIAVSSSQVSTFTNNEDSRRNVFYTSQNKLSNSEELTIISKAPYTQGSAGQVAEDKITCAVKKENTTPEYECSMISKLYNADSSLARTSYFPGDGYQYTVEGENKTKSAYPNTSLVTYFTALIGGAQTYMSYLILDNSLIETYKMYYETKISFSFGQFMLSKQIDVNYNVNEENLKIELSFNSRDYITKVVDPKLGSSLDISYSKINLEFPVFAGFTSI